MSLILRQSVIGCCNDWGICLGHVKTLQQTQSRGWRKDLTSVSAGIQPPEAQNCRWVGWGEFCFVSEGGNSSLKCKSALLVLNFLAWGGVHGPPWSARLRRETLCQMV